MICEETVRYTRHPIFFLLQDGGRCCWFWVQGVLVLRRALMTVIWEILRPLILEIPISLEASRSAFHSNEKLAGLLRLAGRVLRIRVLSHRAVTYQLSLQES